MAGDKSLDVYSISVAEGYYRAALRIFDFQSTCADRASVVRVVVRLLEALHQKCDYRDIDRVAGKFMPLVQEAGETPELVLALYYQGLSLFASLEFPAAHRLFDDALRIAQGLGRGGLAHMPVVRCYKQGRCWL